MTGSNLAVLYLIANRRNMTQSHLDSKVKAVTIRANSSSLKIRLFSKNSLNDGQCLMPLFLCAYFIQSYSHKQNTLGTFNLHV